MARIKDREKALALRRQGKSYSQIKKILKVSKGTLSYWLRDYPLSKEKIRELRDWNEQRIERFRETMRRKREDRLQKTYKAEKKILLPLTKREFYLTGLLLYWGEGTKSQRHTLSVSNTDPVVIKFFIQWVNKCLFVSKEKIRIYLHLYNDMNVDKEIKYWSEELRIPLSQFSRPYIKKTSSKRINHKGTFGHGTCNAIIYSVPLTEKVLMGIKAISDRYNKNF